VKLKQGIARANFELALPARIKVVDPMDDEPYPLDGLGHPGTIHYPASPYADASGNIGSLHNVAIGDRIGIDGDRFDPHGGPITISYDGTAVEKLPAKQSFITSGRSRMPAPGPARRLCRPARRRSSVEASRSAMSKRCFARVICR
jgi:hypothetical protein